MNSLKYIFLIGAIASLVSSCEDPIDVDLAEAESLLIVDAWLDDMSDSQTIQLSYSQPYFDSLSYTPAIGAEVVVTNGAGQEFEFTDEDNDGFYNLVNGSEWMDEPFEQTYNLSINLDDKTYMAATGKNPVPQIDSIWQELRVGEPFQDDGIYCNFFATDLPGLGDTYWIKTFKNGAYLNRPSEINLAYDAAFSAGAMVDNLVFIQPIQEQNNPVDENFMQIPWAPGDVIRVEIHSISNEAYFYMEVVRDQLLNSENGIFAEPLANTPTNVISTGGDEVLGFFNVASVSFLEEEILAQ